jgi:aminopeptidase S
LITGLSAGANAASNDVDGGLTTMQSPAIALPSGGLRISFRSYLGWSSAKNTDFFRMLIVRADGSMTKIHQRTATNSTRAAVWELKNIDISAFAGQTIRVRIEANDTAGDSYIEAGIDDVVITRL